MGFDRPNTLANKRIFKPVLLTRAYSQEEFQRMVAETPLQMLCDPCHFDRPGGVAPRVAAGWIGHEKGGCWT
jgi:hypothetical protein